MPRICKCGCGQIVKKGKKFIRGHHTRINNPNPKIPLEIRYCICGCKKTFKCRINSKRKFIHGHNTIKTRFKKGQKHLQPQIEKMKNSYYHTHLKGEDNPFYGKKHTEKTKKKIGQRKYPIGKEHFNFGKKPAKKAGRGKGSYYKNIWLRSSYELAYAKYLDNLNIKWIYEPIAFNLGNTTYRPDFYLPKTNEYIEIKGFWRKEAKQKFNLFKKLYPLIKISVLSYKELTKRRVL